MKQSDIRIGSTYETRVSGELVKVEVTHEVTDYRTSRFGAERKVHTFRCKRIDTGAQLPKTRTAAALRECAVSQTELIARAYDRMAQVRDRDNQSTAAWAYYQRAQDMRSHQWAR